MGIPEFLEKLEKRKVLAADTSGERIRFVTHKDIDDEDVDKAIAAFKEILV
jgi:threonine aldolase